MDTCAICHENLESNTHTLAECGHVYHTNCIMTWFRLPNGSNRCPLCNDSGINKIKDLKNVHWSARQRAEDNYKIIRARYRGKKCPKHIKKMIERLKKMEEKYINICKKFKKFKGSKSELTVHEIHKKYVKYRRDRWSLQRRIRSQKALIGYQNNIVNIIIPVKQGVGTNCSI